MKLITESLFLELTKFTNYILNFLKGFDDIYTESLQSMNFVLFYAHIIILLDFLR